jgi:hypothetical protein
LIQVSRNAWHKERAAFSVESTMTRFKDDRFGRLAFTLREKAGLTQSRVAALSARYRSRARTAC